MLAAPPAEGDVYAADLLLVLLGSVLGSGFAELTLALAPSYAGVFTSSLIFSTTGALGAALFMSAAMEALAGRGRRVALTVFWVPLLAFMPPGAVLVALGRGSPGVQPGATDGLLFGTGVERIVAWAASSATAARRFGPHAG